jgi:hypothetical protein
VVSSLSLPLLVDGESLGALNLYSGASGAFAGRHHETAETFANQCAAALTVSVRQLRQSAVQQQLAGAMVSTSIIDQAIGILMGQQRCTAAAAFDLLRQASQNRNRKLRDIAVDIITNVSASHPNPGHTSRSTPTTPPPVTRSAPPSSVRARADSLADQSRNLPAFAPVQEGKAA